MANKKDTPDEAEDSVLLAAAKTIGKAAGKIAAVVAPLINSSPAEGSPAKRALTKSGKLAKKNKKRLPRKQKKALQKAGKVQG